MPTNSQQNTPSQDEIDLITLFTKLGEFTKRAFLGLVNMIGTVLVFLLRKWYYFLVAVILTVISALALNKISDPYYYSELVMRSNATHNQSIMSSLDKLGDEASAHNYTSLSSKLNLSIEDARAIIGLETFWYYDIEGDGIFDGIDTDGSFLSDTSVTKVDSMFVLRAAVYEPGVLDKLEEAMINYLENNPYLEALNKQRILNLKSRLYQTEYEIAKLDSLQKREYFTNTDQLRQKEGQIVFTSEKVVRTYHRDMFRLLKLKQDCELDLNIFSDVVTIVEGFSIPVSPSNSLIKYAKKLIWYYLALSLVVALIITFRKKIWTR